MNKKSKKFSFFGNAGSHLSITAIYIPKKSFCLTLNSSAINLAGIMKI